MSPIIKEQISFPSPIGKITISRSSIGVCDVCLCGFAAQLTETDKASAALLEAKKQVLEYLAGSRKIFTIPLDLEGLTPFQRNVLELTVQIPFGEIRRYGQIAQMMGKPNASRAVGGALAHNPIPLFIPCHRVVASNGALTGFSAADGISTKQWLLEMEGHKIVNQKLD